VPCDHVCPKRSQPEERRASARRAVGTLVVVLEQWHHDAGVDEIRFHRAVPARQRVVGRMEVAPACRQLDFVQSLVLESIRTRARRNSVSQIFSRSSVILQSCAMLRCHAQVVRDSFRAFREGSISRLPPPAPLADLREPHRTMTSDARLVERGPCL